MAGPPGSACRDGNAEAERAADLGARVVRVRVGVVLAKDGGALDKMLLPFKLGLGGRVASGTQVMSWIHLDDVVGMILFALETEGETNDAPEADIEAAVKFMLEKTGVSAGS